MTDKLPNIEEAISNAAILELPWLEKEYRSVFEKHTEVQGKMAGLDHITNFINSLDTEGMTPLQVRSAIYKECIQPTKIPDKIKYVQGNLIDLAIEGHFDIIVQGCNCTNTMGSGLAKEIKERIPEAFEADFEFMCNRPDIFKLGNWSETDAVFDIRLPPYLRLITVINAYTQVGYLPRGIDHFEYESFALILHKLADVYPGERWGFPYIGCGLAGGNQERIVDMIKQFAYKVDKQGGEVTLVEFKP